KDRPWKPPPSARPSSAAPPGATAPTSPTSTAARSGRPRSATGRRGWSSSRPPTESRPWRYPRPASTSSCRSRTTAMSRGWSTASAATTSPAWSTPPRGAPPSPPRETPRARPAAVARPGPRTRSPHRGRMVTEVNQRRGTVPPAPVPRRETPREEDLMKKMIAVIAVLAGALLTGACADQRDEPAEAFAPTAEQPAKPVRLQWWQPATVSGTTGSKLKGTPIGVLYDKGSPDIEPENGVFVVIALRAEAVDQPETIAAPITGGGFMWQGADAQKISGTEGNAVITPWVGSVNEFSNVPIQPG